MKQFVCYFIRKKVVSLIVFFIFIVSASYLIMVDRTPARKQPLSGSSIHFTDLNLRRSRLKLPKRTSMSRISSSRPRNVHEEEVKVILMWSSLFEEWAQTGFLVSGMDSFNDSGCPESRCIITADRRRLLASDAVVFHARTVSLFDLPHVRSQRQKWIFFSMEAPPYSRFHGLDFMSGMFNWTMSYRSDSDIVVPYGRIVHQRSQWNVSGLFENWKRKSKMAVWMVSHCSTDSNREKYVAQLKNFVEVDVFGSCGMASCPMNKTNLCIERFSKQYYFFLAFENAICKDYITEKLFRTLRFSMIPVVLGGGNYSAVAPEHSFIDALSFPSPKQLAQRMIKVASNFTEYRSYFLWRSEEVSVDTLNHCNLCVKLHSKDFGIESTYKNINEWWINKGNCSSWVSS